MKKASKSINFAPYAPVIEALGISETEYQ